LFIKGCTGEQPGPGDDRIGNLFKMYDSNNDGFIEREEFHLFYEISSKNKPETVRENLRSHNIRNDLKKLSEITEESSFQTEDMPRFRISRN
jgi:Ca2+-binding EF-hand superfamily protein